ncbi:MAG TPA: TetR/AcrR family transcriptional regulator [Nocardioides sp.]|nr:TetR/AcrR family transcriptional regulator [Nocardioides sp.]
MVTAKTPPQDWINAGLEALAEGGPDAVRVEQLAARLGVSKGGFYWHFSERGDFLTKMLDAWESTVVEDVIRTIETQGGGPREQLRQLFALARVSATSTVGLGAELAIRDWARRDTAVADRLRRVDDRRMGYLRGLFRQLSPDAEDTEARCLQVYALFIGGPFITAGHGDLTREQVVRRALARLLE